MSKTPLCQLLLYSTGRLQVLILYQRSKAAKHLVKSVVKNLNIHQLLTQEVQLQVIKKKEKQKLS
jgi:hypothetical protein